MAMRPAQWRDFYDGLTRRLAQTGIADASYFLNYGYCGDGEAAHPVPSGTFNASSVRLLYEVVGTVELRDREVVEIGCGRGGNSALLATTFRARVTGVDFSPEAIAFCRMTHPNVAFKVGDALKMPLSPASCDAIVNVESSHSYANRMTFLGEVRRILRPGGWFLYTDFLSGSAWNDMRERLRGLGFAIAADRDTTADMLASRDEVASSWAKMFDDGTAAMADFLGVPGSATYEQLKAGSLEYRIVRSQLDP